MSAVADSTEARAQSEHSNADKMKKRRTVRDRCLGASVAYLDVNTRP